MRFKILASRKNHRYGRLLRFLILFLILLLLLLAVTATIQLHPIMNNMASARISNMIQKAVSEAVSETICSGNYQYKNLITLEKDHEGHITALTSNMIQFNRLQSEISENVMKKVGTVSSSEISIPVGSLTGIAVFAGRGPGISVRILSVGAPAAEFENRLTDAGINQTKHQIVLHIQVVVQMLMPGYTTSTTVSHSLAVAETVIVGSVPETYTYFHSDSQEEIQDYVTNQ